MKSQVEDKKFLKKKNCYKSQLKKSVNKLQVCKIEKTSKEVFEERIENFFKMSKKNQKGNNSESWKRFSYLKKAVKWLKTHYNEQEHELFKIQENITNSTHTNKSKMKEIGKILLFALKFI